MNSDSGFMDALRRGLKDPMQAFAYLTSRPQTVPAAVQLAISSRFELGTNILNREWDVAIILDTCRVDALKCVSDAHSFLDDVGSVWSCGGSTLEWAANTFTSPHRDRLRNLAYVTSNGWPKRILSGNYSPEEHQGAGFAPTNWKTVDPSVFGLYDEVWRIGDPVLPGDAPTHVEPRYVTDHAIAHWRLGDYERMVVHYIQPHAPYAHSAVADGRDELRAHERTPFEYLRDTGERGTVWDSYLRELRAVLEEVSVLLANVDATRVVVTSDHGEAFGEWGGYGHYSGSFNPYIRRVPWVETTAVDEETRCPDVSGPSATDEDIERKIEDHLADLGYL